MSESANDATARRWKLVHVVALIVNAAIVLLLVHWFAPSISRFYGIGFADDYDQLAFNLAQGNGYRLHPDTALTLMREPGYPLFLGGVFSIFGYSIEAARFANVLLVIAITMMIAKLARTVSDQSAVPTVAVLLFLFHPGTLIAEVRGSVEIFFIFLVMIFMLVLHRALRRGDRAAFLLAGCALGAVVLTRSTPLLFPMLLLAYLIATAASTQERIKAVLNVGMLVAAMVVVMSPWIIRNWALTKQFVPTASVQGVAAQTGQYICSRLTFETNFLDLDRAAARERDELARQLGRDFKVGYYQYFYAPEHELEFNKLLLGRVAANYRQNPMLLSKCASVNVFNFWFAGKTWRVTWVNVMFQTPFIIIALVGAYLVWRWGQLKKLAVVLLFVVYLFALHVPIHAQARYSVPLVPFLSILAAITLVSSWRRVFPESALNAAARRH